MIKHIKLCTEYSLFYNLIYKIKTDVWREIILVREKGCGGKTFITKSRTDYWRIVYKDHFKRRNKEAAKVFEECCWCKISICFPLLGTETPLPLLVKMTEVDKKSWRGGGDQRLMLALGHNICSKINCICLIYYLDTYPETWEWDRHAGSKRSW